MSDPFAREIDTAIMPLAPRAPSSFGESVVAGWRATDITDDSWGTTDQIRADIIAELNEALGPMDDATEARYRGYADQVNSTGRLAPWRTTTPIYSNENILLDRASLAAVADPGAWANRPTTLEALEAEVNRRRQAIYDEAQEVLAMGGTGTGVAEFIGGGARAMTDPVSLSMMPLGGGGGGLLRIVAREAVLGAAGEAAIFPTQRQVASELDVPEPDLAENVMLGAAFGGLLGGTVHGAGRGYTYMRERFAARLNGPETGDAADQAIAIDQAEARLRANQDPAMDLPPPNAEPNGTPSIDDYNAGLRRTESGGNYAIVNSEGYTGAYQFGQARLDDYNRATGQNITLAEFRANRDIQEAAQRWNVEDTDRFITTHGLDRFIGQEISGVVITHNGMRAMAHLGGNGGMRRFLESRGQYNPADSNGTHLSSYAATHGRGAAAGNAGNGGGASTGGSTSRPAGSRRGYTAPDQVVTPGGFSVAVEYEVVDASTLLAATGDIQPRDRSRAASDEQIADIAARLDPTRLMPWAEADRGAPVVGPDGVIESGNGRVRALMQAAAVAPDRYGAYVDEIRARGFDIPEGVQQPVLIARRTQQLSKAERSRFAREANQSGIARMSATEQAASDAALLDDSVLGLYRAGRQVEHADNRHFTRSFLARLPQGERAGLVTRRGGLSVEGARRIRQALFARAYGAADLIDRYTEADSAHFHSLTEALADAAPSWAGLRADIASGALDAGYDISENLLEAVRLISMARRDAAGGSTTTATAIKERLGQGDLMQGQVHPLTEALVAVFQREVAAQPGKTQIRSSGDIAEILTRYVDEARALANNNQSLFGDALSSGPMEVLNAIDRDAALFAPGGPGTRPSHSEIPRRRIGPEPEGARAGIDERVIDLDTFAARETEFSQGTDSPLIQRADQRASEDLRTAISAPRDPARADLLADGDFEIDGQGTRASELLDDLDADDDLVAAFDACLLGKRGGAG